MPLSNLLKDFWPQHSACAELIDVSYHAEAGGKMVGYSWGRVTCLIKTYCVRETFLWGNNLALQLHTRVPWGEERRRCQFANGSIQP